MGRHLENPIGHPVEKGAVVADDDVGEQTARAEHLLEPQNAVQIEVICGLVEEQHLGVGGEGGGDRQALAPTPRQLADRLLGRPETELVKRDGDPDLAFGLVLAPLRVEHRAARRHLDDRG